MSSDGVFLGSEVIIMSVGGVQGGELRTVDVNIQYTPEGYVHYTWQGAELGRIPQWRGDAYDRTGLELTPEEMEPSCY